ncbi:MAG: hypothetical protein WCQ96_02900 [Patescibacteria group bacterium]
MTAEEYYTAPSENVFEEIKKNAIEIWSGYDDTYGYATDKIESIKNIKNISDNCAYIVAMFDPQNQLKLMAKVKDEEAHNWLMEVLKDNFAL